MEFRLLGPLEVLDGDARVDIGGGKRRSLLGLLLLSRNELVPAERLVDELWAGEPPSTAPKTLQVHISTLRRELARGDGAGGHEVLVTRGNGYCLHVSEDDFDVRRFER